MCVGGGWRNVRSIGRISKGYPSILKSEQLLVVECWIIVLESIFACWRNCTFRWRNAKFSTHKPRCGITVENVIFLPYGAIVEAINIRDGIFYQPTFMVEAVVSLSSLFVEIEGCCDFTNSPEALQLAHLVDFNLSTLKLIQN